MDEYTAKQLQRIERKIDAVLGLITVAIGIFGIQWVSGQLQKNYGWGEEWSFWVALIAFIALISLLEKALIETEKALSHVVTGWEITIRS